ncbi:cadherin-related family member 5 [Leptodactylus fuscus]|uniref:cadherin-related family member 5 n=1 Tax=Leptodactylus fuscus TaxID=238119 RepID=UPI003F4E73E4
MGPLLALCILFLIPVGCFSQACRSENFLTSIREDEKPGTVVTPLIVEPDHTVEVDSQKFGISEINGSYFLVLIEEVDYQKDKLIEVLLRCKKNGQIVPGQTIFVQIINVNTKAPVFKETSYNFSILENTPVNTAIGPAIEAEDADGDTLYYEIISNDTNAAAYFRLTSVTYPVLLVNKPLDYDLYPQIHFNLTARDTQDPAEHPSFTATTSILINIIDADDKPPFFLPCTPIGTKLCLNNGYRSSINRSEIAAEPLQLLPGPLYAVDGDYGINDPVAYTIISGDGNNVFEINNITGNITMNKPIHTLGTVLLQVMAYQTNDILKYATTTVQIEVKEKNNFPPTFQKSNYDGTIPTTAENRSFVLDSSDQTRQLQVFAADADFPGGFNPAVVYRIENSTDFSVLRDGYILTNTIFTSPGTVMLLVNATDSTTSESTTAIVTIEITQVPTTTTTTTTTTTAPTTQLTSTINISAGASKTTTSSTRTTTSTTPGTGTTTTTTPSTLTTTSTTPGTGTTTTTTPSTRTTTSTTPGTGTTTTTTPSTRTTTSTTPGTGTTTTTTPSTLTTTSTTPGTGTTTTTTPSTRTTTSTTPGTGTTTTTTPSTLTTTSTTRGTGTTTTTTPSTHTTTSTTPGTGTTTTTTPSASTTTTTTPGTGTTTTTTPSTRTTTSTTRGTGTTTTTTPSTRTTTTTTPGTGTTTTTTPSTRTTISTTRGTGTTTTTTPSTRTTTTTTPGTGTEGLLPSNIYYTASDMAIVGATLGAVLVLSLVGMAFLIYKQYGNTIWRRGGGNNFGGPEDKTEQLINEEDDWDTTPPPNLESGKESYSNGVSSEGNLLSAAVVSTVLTNTAADSQPLEEAGQDSDSEDKKVKSILTKELKEDGGYKSVWFREDAAPEVMVIDGAENGEANDDSEEEFSSQQGADEEEDDEDDDELDPTFTLTNTESNNFTIL